MMTFLDSRSSSCIQRILFWLFLAAFLRPSTPFGTIVSYLKECCHNGGKSSVRSRGYLNPIPSSLISQTCRSEMLHVPRFPKRHARTALRCAVELDSEKIDELQDKLGVKFRNKNLLQQALLHRSSAPSNILSNERLEFLGDAVLQMVVTEKLFKEYPLLDEGKLSALRSELVSTVALSRVAREQGLGAYLLLSAKETRTGGNNKSNALADMVESIIAAVYMDQGIESARVLVERWLHDILVEAVANPEGADFKTRLQEELRRLHLGNPSYDIVKSGPKHNLKFTAHVMGAWQARLGWGDGKSKKEAEQHAAEYSLKMLGDMKKSEVDAMRATMATAHNSSQPQ